ncbi:hypothetical protein [Cognatazoarcus halotolerans]|uniref:hypothetical protein n=1 Tax=Cognatazoarcus halotolerans TaxID=2686016 RepID=UPI001356BA18|nr:hypothetical protein [Cognatazoarcus halotolerans]MCB1899963.1 hypothetical protein [Rhodocyclaceae bacterium]MCP5309272.1 hypothetical protein [Zoogloeaceae bacterium]
MRDEIYILNLCDAILRSRSERQCRFSFLVGDTGRRLPVDAYYPHLRLVIEYHERQHSVAVPFFDNKATVSGVPRGVQRAIYDQRRREVLPQHGLQLIEFSVAEFICKGRRLKRREGEDLQVIRQKLQPFIAQQGASSDRQNAAHFVVG